MSCTPNRFRQSGRQCWSIRSFNYVPPEEQTKWYRVRGMGWPRDKAVFASQFPWQFPIQEVPKSNVKMRGFPTCWSSAVLEFASIIEAPWRISRTFLRALQRSVLSARERPHKFARELLLATDGKRRCHDKRFAFFNFWKKVTTSV